MEPTNKSHLEMNSDSRGFPEWDSLYKNQQVETIPWYEENLDHDLEEEISKQKPLHKGRFLDIGTDPATLRESKKLVSTYFL